MNISEMTEKANDLFVLPESVTRLKACMDDQASSIDDISEIIAYDPALTTQLLRVSNSALYRFPNRIDTVTKAIQVVGTRSTYDLALAYGVSHAFKDIDSQIIDLDKFGSKVCRVACWLSISLTSEIFESLSDCSLLAFCTILVSLWQLPSTPMA